jgi:hypothetical protein
VRAPPGPDRGQPSGRDASIARARCRIAFAAVRVAAMACNARILDPLERVARRRAGIPERDAAQVATSPMRSSGATDRGIAAFLTTSRRGAVTGDAVGAARRMPSCAAPLAIGISASGR